MQAIREVLDREALKNYVVPTEFGNKFEMILVPIENEELKIENNLLENKVLMKHQEENGFSTNILAQESEDVWNDI
jgi:hypothetical protein